MIRLFFFLSLIFPALSSAWTLTADFEQGTVGTLANGPSGLGYAATATFYSNARAFSGSKSAIVNFAQGTEVGTGGSVGWSSLGEVSEGGEVWARGYFYYASPFDWTCSPVVKILRTRVNTSANDHVAWHSIFADSLGRIMISNEVQSYQQSSSTYFDIDQWQSLELYVKFSATAGQGIIRIWKNGILVSEDTTRRTLAASSNISNQGNVYTYWNGGHPQNQTGWIDDFIWTNERPANRDAAGNYMIGPANWGGDGSTTYTVTPSAGANGSISPSAAQTITSGATAQFTVTPNSGYTASVGGTCGGSLAGTVYTTNPIGANCTVSATFASDTTPPALSGLSPTGDQATPGTSIALALTTDENATCRYDLNGVSDYGLMTNYTTTGGTSHSATVTVRKGGVYAPAAKCRDASGNTSASPAWRFAIPDDPKRRLMH